MDYSTMSIVELKKQAKGRRIKQYYIMKQKQLIELLSLAELPADLKIEKLTIHELRDQAKEKGVRGFWALRRDQLVELLFPEYHERNIHQTPSYQNQQNHCDTHKHDSPQQHEPKNVGIENV